MVLKDEELQFLLKRTKLPVKQLNWLLEEERDFDLILEAVSKQPIKKGKIKDELAKFSLPFSVKYLLYRFNKDEKLDIGILSYLANATIEYIPIIQQNKTFRRPTGKLTEDAGKYAIICSGIFREELGAQKIDYNKFIKFASECFYNIGRNYIGKNAGILSDMLFQFNLQKNL